MAITPEERSTIQHLNQSLSRAFGVMGIAPLTRQRRKPLPKTYSFDPGCRWCVEGRKHSQRHHNWEVQK